jgi:hypothetical protein
MSYALHFWKQSSDCILRPPDVLEQIAEGRIPLGIEVLPMHLIRKRILMEFPLIEDFGGKTLTWELGDECFLVSISQHCLDVESHGALGNTLNRLIDIALEFDCRLYDPQTGERYTG